MHAYVVGMSHFEAVLTSVFYPFTLYAGLRLAHRGFTVGELGLVCLGGTSLCLEFLQLTIANINLAYVGLFTSAKSFHGGNIQS